MNILIVHAHPDPRSLNGALKDIAVQHLQAAGHAVQVSDLYAMQWQPMLAAQETPGPEVLREQEKLLWADTVIFQFPLWWFSMPAIMKGWVDRVFSYGFGYGIGEHSEHRWGDRYGEGTLAGKRAMLMVSTGGWEPHYSARGINGPIDDVLFPIQHGILYYSGMQVLPPLLIYRTGRMDEVRFAAVRAELVQRLDTLASVAPLPFRRQNLGDYEIPALTLKQHVAPGQSGLAIHLQAKAKLNHPACCTACRPSGR